MASSSSESETPPAKRKCAVYLQRYLEKWESDAKFGDWIAKSDKGPMYYYCKVCNKDGKAGKSELEKHAAGKKHISNMGARKKTVSVLSMPGFSGKSKQEKQVKEGEIRLAAYISEHNVPFTSMDHLVPLIKAVCPDSEIAKKLKCGRTKCAAVIRNVLGAQKRDDIYEILRNSPFSLIVDESTDRGCTKHLALVARVATHETVKDVFLALIPLESATAADLYNHIKAVLSEAHIPYLKNMVGFAADGASVMMGVKNSLSTLLKTDIPNLFIMKCICHSFNLCASYACKCLPRWVEDMIRDIHNYFLSPKQLGILKEFQEFAQTKPHKLLHPCQTRWLSLHSAVKRVLDQLPALILFFTHAVSEDKLLAAETILQKLNDPAAKLYLEFLDFVLPFFNDLNKEMQSEEPKLFLIHERVTATLSTFLECYIKEDHLHSTPVCSVHFRDPANFLPLEEIYLGGRVTASLCTNPNLDKQLITSFRQRCLQFYIEGVSQILKRIKLSDPVLQDLEAMNPQAILKKTVKSIVPLACHFPNIVNVEDLNAIDNEWRLLRNTDVGLDSDACMSDFWFQVKKVKKGDDSPMFPLIGRFMTTLMCLPHSSAAVERIFSQINLLKTKMRNKMNTATLNGLLHAKTTFDSATCHDFKILPSHLNRMTEEIYKAEDQQQ